MKQSFLSFASRYVVTILVGLGLLMLHSQIGEGLLSIFVPQTTSPWELGKVAFWPLLLVLVLFPSHKALAQCVVATVSLVLVGWLCQDMRGAVWVVAWMLVLALSLSLVAPKEKNFCWPISVFVLTVAFVVLTFYPVYWGPFLDPTDVAAMATIPY